MRHPLSRALAGAGLTTTDVAARLGVDPKTVSRWLKGRVPYPRHRAALAQLTGWTPGELWPDLSGLAADDPGRDEIRHTYPDRSAVPAETWRTHFGRARHQVGILAYSALFLAEDRTLHQVLQQQAAQGVRVRIALGDPDGEHIATRGAEEGIHELMPARTRNALHLLRPLTGQPGIELRLHDTPLLASLYRADDDIFANTHVYGTPASHAPVTHLHRARPGGPAAQYLDCFERVWAAARHPAA